MNDFLIAGIQQIGVGTENFRKSWDWLIEMFGADVRILEDDTVAERMLPYTGGKPQKRHACIAANLQGGGGFEIWQFSERKPQPCPFEIAVGDLGVLAAKVKCRDVAAFHSVAAAKWKETGPLEKMPDGTPCFYIKDLYGNWYQVIERKDIFIEEHKPTGGIAGAVIGVSDIEASRRYYGTILGYDKVLSDTTAPFSATGFLNGGERVCRRVLLARTVPFSGADSGLLGDSTIELVQASKDATGATPGSSRCASTWQTCRHSRSSVQQTGILSPWTAVLTERSSTWETLPGASLTTRTPTAPSSSMLRLIKYL